MPNKIIKLLNETLFDEEIYVVIQFLSLHKKDYKFFIDDKKLFIKSKDGTRAVIWLESFKEIEFEKIFSPKHFKNIPFLTDEQNYKTLQKIVDGINIFCHHLDILNILYEKLLGFSLREIILFAVENGGSKFFEIQVEVNGEIFSLFPPSVIADKVILSLFKRITKIEIAKKEMLMTLNDLYRYAN